MFEQTGHKPEDMPEEDYLPFYEPEVSNITILYSPDGRKLTKSYNLHDGRIIEQGYSRAKWFGHYTADKNGISDLYETIRGFSDFKHICLIRGRPASDIPDPARRTAANFPMDEEGVWWVCLDFDGIELPEGIDPYSREAIEYAVKLLPAEFHSVSYVAQFSASAGILNPDGTPYKPGLRAHVFFWLERPITNEELKGWLFDYPVDKSLFTAVQPHYICNPVLGEDVQCALKERHYLLEKDSDVVQVPDLKAFQRISTRNTAPDNDWEDPPGGPPAFDDLLVCEFVEWYVNTEHSPGERYEQTRSFAHNLRRVQSEDWKALLQQLISPDFPYIDAVIASAENSRPITCEHIYESVYRCPQFDQLTGTCQVDGSARTPYSLAWWIKELDKQ